MDATEWVRIPGGGAGNGIAVLQGWRFFPQTNRERDHAPLEEFQRQSRTCPSRLATWASGRARSATAPLPGTPTRFSVLPVDHTPGGPIRVSRRLTPPAFD